MIPLPTNDDTSNLEQDLKGLKGGLALTEGGDWGGAANGAQATWNKIRLGADPPETLVDTMDKATGEVYAACGINQAVFRDAQGTA